VLDDGGWRRGAVLEGQVVVGIGQCQQQQRLPCRSLAH
jgi:hypothetical protein